MNKPLPRTASAWDAFREVSQVTNSDLATRLPRSITNHLNREATCRVLTMRG